MGSRDQLCIHPEVSKEQNNAIKLHMCHARTTTRSCFYHTNLEAKKEEPDFREPVLDIEDLVVLGKKHSACPYFMTKEIRKSADIIFMPYNYLLDPKVRKIHNIELQVWLKHLYKLLCCYLEILQDPCILSVLHTSFRKFYSKHLTNHYQQQNYLLLFVGQYHHF